MSARGSRRRTSAHEDAGAGAPTRVGRDDEPGAREGIRPDDEAENDDDGLDDIGLDDAPDVAPDDAPPPVLGRAPSGEIPPWSWRLSLPGCWVMLVFAAASFTPSLMPRPGLYQGLVTGITGAIGYGLGVLLAWVWRQFANRPARAPSRGWWIVLVVIGVAVLGGASVMGQRWQSELREVMGVEAIGGIGILVPPSAFAVSAVLIGIGRLLAWAEYRIAALLRRRIGPAAARFTGIAVVVGATWVLVSGVLVDVGRSAADEIFALRDRSIEDGVTRSFLPERSGSPESLVSWESLGMQGRRFVADGPSAEQIAEFTGTDALEPIRVYAGLGSAEDSESRAALAVAELERTGAFERSHLLVVTTTGSGWVSPTSAAAFEYLTGGDSAIAATQYSYLPSWMSYLVDQARARDEGRDLFDAVYGAWMQLPVDDRPELYVNGESLGSFGGESAFSGANDIVNRTSGALWVGPPNFNELYRTFTDARDPGSTEIEPVFRDGRSVRFTSRPGELITPIDRPWEGTRVLYLVHPSDPVVWWDTDLLWSQPDWLREPRGHDVLDAMTWLPIITFWQITFDLPVAGDVPPGHGHIYAGQHVDGWAQVLHIEDWDAERSEELRELVMQFHRL